MFRAHDHFKNCAGDKLDMICHHHLQLIMSREHICRSSGYNFKFIGQESVNEILDGQDTKVYTWECHEDRVGGAIPLEIPNAVQDVAIREDPDVNIWDDDVVEVSLSLVGKEEIRHPDFLGIREGEVLHFP